MTKEYKIISNILSYFKRLEIMYRSNKECLLYEIIINCSIFVEKTVSYDDWENDRYGHAIILFVNEDTIEKISSIELQKKLTSRINSDLQGLVENIPNEFIASLWIELADNNSLNYQSSIKLTKPIVKLDNLNIWQPEYIKLFISHKDEYKKEATYLAKKLEGYGISSFVAHDTIEPLEKWQNTIITALQSMELMMVFITDGFFKSCWTNQEIGFALGREVPVISLKLQKEAPQGFIQDTQAIVCALDLNQNNVNKIYKVLSKKLNHEEKITKSLIHAFINSPNFEEALKRFNRLQSLEKIADFDIKKIIKGFSDNSQLYNCRFLAPKFLSFLKKRTDQDYEINNNHQIVICNELPF